MYQLPLGGTAVGTGLNAPPGFAAEAIAEIVRRTGLPFRGSEESFRSPGGEGRRGVSERCAARVCGGIDQDRERYPLAGLRAALRDLGELKMPAVQPGSSIMPGKVNPVIAESLLMVCAQVIGYDATIAWCGAAGNFELNLMMPVMA